MRLLGDLQGCMRIEVDAPNTKNKGEIPPVYYAFILTSICRGGAMGV